jgi:hypothetical protein
VRQSKRVTRGILRLVVKPLSPHGVDLFGMTGK